MIGIHKNTLDKRTLIETCILYNKIKVVKMLYDFLYNNNLVIFLPI